MDSTIMNTYMQTQYQKAATAAAEKTSKSLSGITQESTEEEITEAVKSFETYLMEQVIKEVKETMVPEEDEDSTISMYKDFFMDPAYTNIASQLVDQIGGDITQDFVEQIMRNYGITGTTNLPQENADVDSETVSDDIAKTNSSTVTEIMA